MPNYQNGKIYTIRSHQTDEIYIGSTANCLSKRFTEHKADYKRWKDGKRQYTTSFKIIDFGDAYIELLENYSCADKNELNRREGELIRETKCVNRCIAGRTSKQYNKDNREAKLAYQMHYEEKNKEKISARKIQHYNNNKEMRTCVCGGEYNYGNYGNRNKHYSSTKHTSFVENFYENLRELTCQ